MTLVLRILLLISGGVSFAYGCIRFVGKRTALFKSLITFALGCFTLGRLYELLTLFLQGEIPGVFHVGMLAVLGGFAFLFSASYGSMDGLVDDRSTGLRKYRLLALLAPLAVAALFVPVWRASDNLTARLVAGVEYLTIAIAAFYNLKHLIIPDVSFGIIRSIRGYNFLAFLLELLYAVQLTAETAGNEVVWAAASVCIVLLCPAVLPVMERGSRKWTL